MSSSITEMDNKTYKFNISLSVLNHLGRNLYRNFITVLGEAISNSWDADAKNVWIVIDKDNGNFIIKDDGVGMTSNDFENKFLKIGYSKRKSRSDGSLETRSPGRDRPYIGAKGIGKLALLSCADIISVISKTANTDYTGGAIDNRELDKAIENDDVSEKYKLEKVNDGVFKPYIDKHEHGTIIHFKGFKKGIRKTIPNLKKMLALYFRFSLLDDNFNIHLNGKKIILDDLQDLSGKTEFLWKIDNFKKPPADAFKDPFIDTFNNLASTAKKIDSNLIEGFVTTVNKPRDLKIANMEEKVGVDLIVNGRLRERDLLKHIPSARIVESYMYGQIHCNELDADDQDRFTSGREGVIESDEKYQSLLSELQDNIIPKIINEWDALRLSRNKDGDDENPRKTKKQRNALSLYNTTAKELGLSKKGESETWVEELRPDAEFNIPSYTECYLVENLLRKYITHKEIDLANVRASNRKNMSMLARDFKKQEAEYKKASNINIDIRENDDDLNYLDMDCLTKIIDPDGGGKTNSISNDGKEYKPIRNAVMHTALLTSKAKIKLGSIYNNITASIKKISR